METQRSEPRKKVSKVKQACDCCHTRKIRCDGDDPCVNCQATELRCTYLTVPKKKGPKGPRIGKIQRANLRRKEDMINRNATPRIPPLIVPQVVEQRQLLIEEASSFKISPLISSEIIRRCVSGFFDHKYPIMPILHREQIYASLDSLHDHPEQYGLVTALCAMIIQQPEILGPTDPSNGLEADDLPSSKVFIAETHRARRFCDHIEYPTLVTIQTSFFLFATLFSTGRDNSAWFYIREAMTMLQLKRFHEEDTYSRMVDVEYATYCRRTFWLLFITERAYALQRHRPLTLQRTIDLPIVCPGAEATILSGFLDLVSLFQNFDDKFLSLWNLSSTDSSTSSQSLVRLQDILRFALPDVSNRTEIQQADLLVSKQWLKTMVWQLCVAKGLLSSSATNESMSFQYPVTIAREVVLVSRLLPPKAFEANGVGILEKVFDIGCSLVDVLLLHPNSVQVSNLEIGPRDYLMELMRILGTVLGGSSRYLRLLAAKADESLHIRLGASLSESENSSEMVVIEDFDDEADETYGHEVHEARINDPDGEVQALAGLDSFTSAQLDDPQRSYSLHGLSPTYLANEIYNMPSLLSTPNWNKILEGDSVLRGALL